MTGLLPRRGITLVLAVLLAFPFAVRAELVDRIMATVNSEVISKSELGFAIALNRRFGNADGDRDALETETLNGLITRRLLVQEAHRIRYVEVSEREAGAEIELLAKRFPSDKAFNDFLAELEMSPREVARMLGEQLLVKRFVEKKIGLFVRVGRDEAQSYFNGHPDEFKNKRFQDVQKTIVALLTEQQVGRQLDQYLAELRGKAYIRINSR
jgi:hypothetical protein